MKLVGLQVDLHKILPRLINFWASFFLAPNWTVYSAHVCTKTCINIWRRKRVRKFLVQVSWACVSGITI